jgi:hypothetical protein
MTLTEAFRQRALSRRLDRRRFQRVKVSLPGRFMLEDRQEYPCRTTDMSPGSAAIATPVSGRPGERVVAYVDQVGRIDGAVARTFGGGFVMTINATPRKRDRLAAQLTWLANRHELGLPEDRRHERIRPQQAATTLTLADGVSHPARIIDLSLSGAAVSTAARPPAGAPVLLGGIRAIVVRQFEEGVAVEFAVVQSRESLDRHFS